VLLTLGGVSAVAGWVLADMVDRLAGRSVPVPWTAPATLAILAVALVFWAVGMRRRLREGRVDPFVATRTAALAMAASRTGAIATGVYTGFLVWFAGQWYIEAARGRGFASLAAVVAGLLVIVAALWLERICRIKGDNDDDDDGSTDTDSAADWVHPRVG
jgi:ABC-type antimicrobial peptide transport system permease subunit